MLALALAGPGGSCADVVRLTNGRALDGVVERETPELLILNVGVGSVTLRRDQIRSVERSGVAGEAQAKKQWREKYFAHEKYAPKGFEQLAADFRGLEGARAQAVQASAALGAGQRELANLQAQMKQAQADLVEAARRMQDHAPQAGTVGYNQLVEKNNECISRITVLRDAFRRNGEAAEGHRQTIARYHAALAAFGSALASAKEARAGRPADEASAYFLEQSGGRMAAYRRDFAEVAIPMEPNAEHACAKSLVNGRETLNLIVDTGATFIALNETAARRLGLNPPDEPILELTQADGTKIRARPVVLDSVEVDGARIEYVPAVVLPSDIADGYDGLLGMSFLREFAVNLDTAHRKVVLERFAPR
jgi:aspartyl protease family protein